MKDQSIIGGISERHWFFNQHINRFQTQKNVEIDHCQEVCYRIEN